MKLAPQTVQLALALGISSLTAFSARATPLVNEPNRDVVRNPYSSMLGDLNRSSASASPVITIDSGSGAFPSIAALGGNPGTLPVGSAGGVGIPSGGAGIPSVGGTAGSGGGGGMGSLPSGTGGAGPLSPDTIMPAPLPPVSTSPGTSADVVRPPGASSAPIVTAAAVADGGESIILLGAGLVTLFLFRRRLFQSAQS